MPTVRQERIVVLALEDAVRLWTDLDRWATFVEGFAHVRSLEGQWPAEGTKLVWTSIPQGRGQVTERVERWEPPADGGARLATRVFDRDITGLQTLSFSAADDGTEVVMQLDYELQPTTPARVGPLGKITDVLFIRRALSDSLDRTLRRFATEAEEEADLLASG
jgi:hypothetical protein